jgi:hypothetical protein
LELVELGNKSPQVAPTQFFLQLQAMAVVLVEHLIMLA